MLRHICVINGPGEHGKDTFLRFACERAGQLEVPGFNFSSIDPCRQWVFEEHGIPPTNKSDEARKLLVARKQRWLAEDPDGPTMYLLDSIATVELGLVFLHIREPEQIARLLELAQEREAGRLSIETVHVIRPGHPIPNNPIDQGTLGPEEDPFLYDLFLENAGTEGDLRDMAYAWTEGRVITPTAIETMQLLYREGTGLPSGARC